jgi:hypothetical protein
MKVGTKIYIPDPSGVPGPHFNFGKTWTDAHKQLLSDLFISNATIRSMAIATGRDVGGVVRKLEHMGLARETYDGKMERLVPTARDVTSCHVNDACMQADAKETNSTKLENTMPITITTYTEVRLNGENIANKTDAELYSIIKREQDAIKALCEIKSMPVRLFDELKAREQGVLDLVDHMNAVYKAEKEAEATAKKD